MTATASYVDSVWRSDAMDDAFGQLEKLYDQAVPDVYGYRPSKTMCSAPIRWPASAAR